MQSKAIVSWDKQTHMSVTTLIWTETVDVMDENIYFIGEYYGKLYFKNNETLRPLVDNSLTNTVLDGRNNILCTSLTA